ncbi:thiamine pyrophosphate-dependent enzyme [Nocardia gipuzkoensis]
MGVQAFNWAAVNDAPLIFFCQNNQWAISTRRRPRAAPHSVRAAGFGLTTTLVDGNDMLAVHAATSAAAQRVRAGGPPELIEAITYRMGGHSTSDDPTRYRADEEVQLWEQRDPVLRVRRLLDQQDWVDANFHRNLEAEADELAEATRAACRALEPPPLEETFRNTLVEETTSLRQERERYTAWRNSFA